MRVSASAALPAAAAYDIEGSPTMSEVRTTIRLTLLAISILRVDQGSYMSRLPL